MQWNCLKPLLDEADDLKIRFRIALIWLSTTSSIRHIVRQFDSLHFVSHGDLKCEAHDWCAFIRSYANQKLLDDKNLESEKYEQSPISKHREGAVGIAKCSKPRYGSTTHSAYEELRFSSVIFKSSLDVIYSDRWTAGKDLRDGLSQVPNGIIETDNIQNSAIPLTWARRSNQIFLYLFVSHSFHELHDAGSFPCEIIETRHESTESALSRENKYSAVTLRNTIARIPRCRLLVWWSRDNYVRHWMWLVLGDRWQLAFVANEDGFRVSWELWWVASNGRYSAALLRWLWFYSEAFWPGRYERVERRGLQQYIPTF